jgi:hypothetical protein
MISAPFWLLMAFWAGAPQEPWSVEAFRSQVQCVEAAKAHNANSHGLWEYCAPSNVNPFAKSPA